MTVKKEPTTVQAAGFFFAPSRGKLRRKQDLPPTPRPAACGLAPALSRPGPGHSCGVSRCCPGGNPSRRESRCCSGSLQAARPLLFPILSRCSPAVRRAPTRFPGSRHESPLIRRDPPRSPHRHRFCRRARSRGAVGTGPTGKGAASLLRLFRGRFRRDPLLPLHGTFGSLKGTSLAFPASAAGKSLLRATFSVPLPGATPPCLPHARRPGPPSFACPFPDKKSPTFHKGTSGVVGQFSDLTADAHADPRRRGEKAAPEQCRTRSSHRYRPSEPGGRRHGHRRPARWT